MSILEPVVRKASAPRRPGRRADPPNNRPGFEKALSELAQAITQRRVEAICVAYLLLRRAASGMSVREMLDAADRAAGGDARLAIVSAFSQRRCFMCRTGSSRCKNCDGAGVAEAAVCPQCEGLGVEACDFCRGGAWSDLDEVPPELRSAAARWRLVRVEKDLGRLGRLPPPTRVRRMHVTPQERRELSAWLIRLRGRLALASGIEADNGKQRADRLAAAAEKIEQLLDAIRPGRH